MASDHINVLDHGFVRLVESMGSDLSIARAARVSYDAAWRAGENEGSDSRLIHYLWGHRHTTPFEAVEFQFEVKAPIFVFRQWHRHRTWTYNELSARYRPLPDEFYVPATDVIGVQAKDNKQARSLKENANVQHIRGEIEAAGTEAYLRYQRLLAMGTPRELARSVLPVSIYSCMFAKTNLRNLLHFLDLRDDPHAQYEIRVYAEAMRELARSVAPVAIAAWEAGRASS